MTVERKNTGLLLGFIMALFVLLIARSALAPLFISQYAPVLASALIIISCVPRVFNLVVPVEIWYINGFSLVFVCSTLISGDINKSFQAFGIVVLWSLAVLVGSNLNKCQWSFILKLLIAIGIAETLIASGETVFQLDWVRFNIAADASGIYSIRENLLLDFIPNRAQGTIGYPIPFSHLISIAFIVVIAGDVVKRPATKFIVGSAILFGMLLSGTRTSIIAVAVAIVTYLYLDPRFRGNWFRTLMVILTPLVASLLIWNLASTESGSTDYSFTHRLGVVESVGNILFSGLKQFSIGSGYNSHEELFERGIIPGMYTYAVDNGFVSILISAGILGFFCFILFFIVSIGKMDILGCSIMALTFVYGLSYDFVFWHLLMFLTMAIVGRGLATPKNGIGIEPNDFIDSTGVVIKFP